MRIESIKELAEIVRGADNITVLTHVHPDGDTIGAGFALCRCLRMMGKKANVVNSDEFPKKFGYIFNDYREEEFEEKFVISVDIADTKLLGDRLSVYADRIDLCIDHHGSNKMFAKANYVDGGCCAVCLIIYDLMHELGIEADPLTADCLYTGIATDTGCFMYENTSPEAHRAAAVLIERGAHAAPINREMFQIKSRGRILSEQKLISGMKFADSGEIALICITNDIIDSYGVDRADLDGFAGIPLSVAGVRIGITLKQQAEDPGLFKASIRTVDADAAGIAAIFGGGGHSRAAGCTVPGEAGEVSEKLIAAAEKFL